MIILAKLLMILIGIALYVKGECYTKWLGKSNKNYKMAVGLPISLIPFIGGHYLLGLICILSYVIAGSMGYGDSNWLTKLVGKMNAIIICGVLLGLASFSVIGWLAILAGLLSGYVWYYLQKKDGIINEPYVAIGRSASALCLTLF